MKHKSKTAILCAAILLVLLFGLIGCTTSPSQGLGTDAPIRDKPYSEELERRIALELANETRVEARPDYLPSAMFANLPPFPDDFYSIRNLIRLGRITDLETLEEKYWMQPEFFPNFEEIGVPLLQNPPEGRWGAYGIASYPAESIGTIEQGETLDFYYYMKSSYLVETYQGIYLKPSYQGKSDITAGVELPDGSRSVTQDPEAVSNYFDVQISPNPFLLEPNFPVYSRDGTIKVKVSITAKPNAPPGNYVVGIDTGAVPEPVERQWLRKHLTLYANGGMTKLDKPYFQAFLNIQPSSGDTTETNGGDIQ